jgi:hypothetical protein
LIGYDGQGKWLGYVKNNRILVRQPFGKLALARSITNRKENIKINLGEVQ